MGSAILDILQADQEAEFHPFKRLEGADLDTLKQCKVAIEFTVPEAASGVIKQCLENGIPVVSGTTGWHQNQLNDIIQLCHDVNGKFLYASNFSIGMNVTFELSKRLSTMMNRFPEFSASIREIHHIHKKDSPSGTAVTLINEIIETSDRYTGFELNEATEDADENKINVNAIRKGEVKGFHEITWTSGDERIVISHEAFDRKIFAQGAVMAAKWLVNQDPGVYTMRDIIKL
jgi:4-hydroxy-tetrahydrodipicolinate reductase